MLHKDLCQKATYDHDIFGAWLAVWEDAPVHMLRTDFVTVIVGIIIIIILLF